MAIHDVHLGSVEIFVPGKQLTLTQVNTGATILGTFPDTFQAIYM